jgi:hypothetical protein
MPTVLKTITVPTTIWRIGIYQPPDEKCKLIRSLVTESQGSLRVSDLLAAGSVGRNAQSVAYKALR